MNAPLETTFRQGLSGFVAAYVAALCLIAATVGASHWIAIHVIAGQSDLAKQIDIAGKQRMLSQRIALHLTELSRGTDPEAALADLKEARDEFRASHQGLLYGDADRRLDDRLSAEMQAIYFGAPHEVDAGVTALLAAADEALWRRGPAPEAMAAAATSLAKGPLLAGLDRAVKQMEAEARDNIVFAQRLSAGLLIATLLALIAEGLFIFHPLARRLRHSGDALLSAHQELRHSLRHDPLTGLPNRRHMREFLDMTLAHARRHSRRVGLLQIDLRGFRAFNDSRGDEVGDLVLQRVAGLIRLETRKGDFVARVGADEFAVVAPTADTVDEMMALAERLSHLIVAPFELGGEPCELRCAVAVALSEMDEVDPVRLSKDLDIAIAAAKREGDGPILFTPDLRAAFEAREALRADLKRALEEGEIEPFFQPQICVRTGRLDGFEALARWRHPDNGVLGPGVFLDAAAAFDMGERLEEIILEKSLDALVSWRKAGLDAPRVGVNFSAEQLRDPFMAEKIKWAVDARDLAPKDVCIEILESVLVEEEDDAVAGNIAGLARNGFHIDLDDFGTGHASIATLQRFQVHRIKIDRSFVTEIDVSEDQRKVSQAMIDLAHSLGVAALAEGVEHESERAALAEMGCDEAQGFGIGGPMDAAATAEWIAAYRPAPAATNALEATG